MSTYVLTTQDKVWNRACDTCSAVSLAAGDRALRDMLHAHNSICSGGVLFMLETLTEDELEAAKAGYLFYGLPKVARLLSRTRKRLDAAGDGDDLDDLEEASDREYYRLVPDDDALARRFERHYAAQPLDFAPLP